MLRFYTMSNSTPVHEREIETYNILQTISSNILLQREFQIGTKFFLVLGRAIAQAFSRWLPTAAARVRTRVWSSEICDRQSGAGAGFLRVLQFPLLIFTIPDSPSSQSLGASTIGQKWPTCRVDPVWTPSSHNAIF
jgi:hypothetical protein